MIDREGGGLLLRRRHVAHDEQFLAGLDEAELTPGELLDGGGVLTQSTSVLTQLSVVAARAVERLFHRVEVASRLE